MDSSVTTTVWGLYFLRLPTSSGQEVRTSICHCKSVGSQPAVFGWLRVQLSTRILSCHAVSARSNMCSISAAFSTSHISAARPGDDGRKIRARYVIESSFFRGRTGSLTEIKPMFYQGAPRRVVSRSRAALSIAQAPGGAAWRISS